MIEFTHIWAFALIPVPLLAWIFLPKRAAGGSLALPPSIWQVLGAISGTERNAVMGQGLALQSLGWLALVLALAGPYQRGETLVTATGHDLMIALDLSASMGQSRPETTTGPARQIDMIRAGLDPFLTARDGDRVGLIGFATDAYLIAPLSFDTGAVAAMLQEVTIGLPGRRTDIGQAIGLAVQVLRPAPEAHRSLVVISDGQTNAGALAALDAARLAATHRIQVHMIGVAKQVAPETARQMTEIAAVTGGSFQAVSDPDAFAAALSIPALSGAGDAPPETRHLVHDLRWAPLGIALIVLGFIAWREVREQ